MNENAQQFGQLIEPQPVGFSFAAPGWYVVGVLLLLLAGLIGYLIMKYKKKNRYRKEALKLLALKELSLSEPGKYGLLVYETDILTKRVAMGRYGREAVAGLHGDEWINFLNGTWKEASFSKDDALLTGTLIYKNIDGIDSAEATNFVNKVKRWMKEHKYAL